MNLLVNAGQAIEQQGEITITTGICPTDPLAIQIIIQDTGKGIPPENLKNVFDPFFTTKPVGQGTGLGLSISWGIIAKHHGNIEVSSTVGLGSVFTIILPINSNEIKS
jgi:signal transduction histidine kinase